MNLKNRKGVALLIALSVAIILGILATAMLMLVRGHYGTTSSQIKHTRAYYLAEAGVQKALARCRAGNFDDFSFTETTSQGPVTITVNIDPKQADGTYPVHSKVNY